MINGNIQAQKEMINGLIGNIHTCAPGTVISYGSGRAVVQSKIKFRIDEDTMADSPTPRSACHISFLVAVEVQE